MAVILRERSTLKLKTPFGPKDRTFEAGSTMEDVVQELFRDLIYNKGTEEAKAYIEQVFEGYPGVPPCGQPLDSNTAPLSDRANAPTLKD